MKEHSSSHPLYFCDPDRTQPLVFRPKPARLPVPTSQLERSMEKLDAWAEDIVDRFLLHFLTLTATSSLLSWLVIVALS